MYYNCYIMISEMVEPVDYHRRDQTVYQPHISGGEMETLHLLTNNLTTIQIRSSLNSVDKGEKNLWH